MSSPADLCGTEHLNHQAAPPTYCRSPCQVATRTGPCGVSGSHLHKDAISATALLERCLGGTHVAAGVLVKGQASALEVCLSPVQKVRNTAGCFGEHIAHVDRFVDCTAVMIDGFGEFSLAEGIIALPLPLGCTFCMTVHHLWVAAGLSAVRCTQKALAVLWCQSGRTSVARFSAPALVEAWLTKVWL